MWTWPIVFAGQFCLALCSAGLARDYPFCGGIYACSRRAGSACLGWLSSRPNPTDPGLSSDAAGLPFLIKQVLGDALGKMFVGASVAAKVVCTLAVNFGLAWIAAVRRTMRNHRRAIEPLASRSTEQQENIPGNG